MKLGFSKKKQPAGGVEKKPKRKAARGGTDGLAKLKSFFAEHIEKLFLATIAIIALLLVFAGFRKDTLDTDPTKVKDEVARAQSRIASATWAEVKQERQPEADRFDEQATQDSINIDLTAYATVTPLHPRLQEQSKRRTDPELLAPFDLEVRAGYGAVAVKATGRGSTISSLAEANSPDLRGLPADFRRGRGRETRMGGTYESRFFAVITGLVPYKQQFEIYQQAFEGAAEFVPERDVPKYIGLEIERAELQADGSLAAWTPLDTLAGMLREPSKWDGHEEEQADRQYVLPGLTMQLPPLVLRDVSVWARHSSVPLLSPEDARRGGEGRDGREEASPEAVEGGETTWGDRGGSVGREGRSRGRATTERSGDPSVEAADYAETAQPLLKVDNGMLRYFDFTAEPGKVYVYRVRALLDDPNNPSEGSPPSRASCETDVLLRLQQAKETYRPTEWSKPSPNIAVPTGEQVLAGKATTPSTVAVGPNRRLRLERRATDEPTVDVMTLTWKADGPYDVPVQVNAARGAVLNGKVPKTEAVDPTVSRIRTLHDYDYTTGAMVVDIYGGFPLGGDLVAPGFVLVRRADGTLEFHAEMTDFDTVQDNTIPADEEEARRAEETRDEKRVQEEGAETRRGRDRRGGEGPDERGNGRRGQNPNAGRRGPR